MLLLTYFEVSDKHKYMIYTELSKTFNVGEMAVYPSLGICRISNKEERNNMIYLVLTSLRDNSIVLVPEGKSISLGLRHLSSPSSVEEALSLLTDKTSKINPDWKQRISENQTLLKEGTLASASKVVNCLYRRSKIKALPTMERKIYDSALSLLLDEASVVLDKNTGEMRKIVFSKLENV